MVNDEPWFKGRSSATVLGYSNTNKAIIEHVDEEDKDTIQHLVSLVRGNDSLPPVTYNISQNF